MASKPGDWQTRFWAKVVKEDKLGCWLWVGCVRSNGYGIFGFSSPKRSESVHRVSWSLFNGPIPEGMYICHKCDVRNCVNPEHLFLGTHTDNVRDASNKGRLIHGEKHPSNKLTVDDVRAIRAAYVNKKAPGCNKIDGPSTLELARKYGISHQVVQNILHNRIWKHV